MSGTTQAKMAERGGSLLFRLVRSIGVVEGEETRCCGVTTAQCIALLSLGDGKQTTMRDVTAALGVSAGTATRIVDNLVRDDMVQRIADSADRRRVCVRPTAKGRKKITQLEEGYARFWERVFSRVPARKLRDALPLLELVVEAVENSRAECCSGPSAKRQ